MPICVQLEQLSDVGHLLCDIQQFRVAVHRELAQQAKRLLLADALLLHQESLRALDDLALDELRLRFAATRSRSACSRSKRATATSRIGCSRSALHPGDDVGGYAAPSSAAWIVAFARSSVKSTIGRGSRAC